MSLRDNKIMFQIYKEIKYHGDYRVVLFTELNDYDKDFEIDKALAGEEFLSGYIMEIRRSKAQPIFDDIIEKLNEGENLSPEAAQKLLEPVSA